MPRTSAKRQTQAAGVTTRRSKLQPAAAVPAVVPVQSIGFEISPYYESMLEMRNTKPAVFKTLSQAAQTALDCYLTAKNLAGNNEF